MSRHTGHSHVVHGAVVKVVEENQGVQKVAKPIVLELVDMLSECQPKAAEGGNPWEKLEVVPKYVGPA